MEDGEDRVAGPSQYTYLQIQVHKRVLNIADGCRLWEEKSEGLSQSTVDIKRAIEEQEFKSRKHLLEILHKPGI